MSEVMNYWMKEWTLEERELKDAMRGILWEEQYRGTFDDYDGDQDFLKSRAKTWIGLPPPDKIEVKGWPKGFVGWGTYGWKYHQEMVMYAIAERAVMIDTAEGYGFGKVETELGKGLQALDPKQTSGVWLCSKVARNHLGSSTAVVNAARRSRDKLGRPLDLYQIHWPPPKRNYAVILGAMKELLEEGTIKRVGVSNFCAGQLYTAQAIAQKQFGFNIESLQVRVNRFDTSALDYLIPVAKALGLRIIAHSPFGQGKLAREGKTWLMHHVDDLRATGVDYIIPGTNNPEHLIENMGIGAKK